MQTTITSNSIFMAVGVVATAALLTKPPTSLTKLWTKAKYLVQAYATEILSHSTLFRREVPFPGDESISPLWVTKFLRNSGVLDERNSVIKVTIEDLQGNRGLAGVLSRLRLTYSSEAGTDLPATLILKMSPSGINGRRSAIAAGQYREAIFYEELGAQCHPFIPKIYFTYGSAVTGTCIIVMEDLIENQESVGVNMLFGNQIWGVENPWEDAPEQVEVLKEMFMFAAELHAKYWNDHSLLNSKWIKSAGWYKGMDRAKWELAIDTGRSSWEKLKVAIADGSSGVKWSPKFIKVLDASYAATSWAHLQEHLNDRKIPFTLCHGDFHAGNMIWLKNEPTNHLRVVDWSEVGVWEPTADLGQTIISDVKASIWRDNDVKLLRLYWEKLVSLGVSAEEYPFDMCLERYERAPVERWIWVFSLMSTFGLPPIAIQYFHDQILSFIEAHGDHDAYILKPVVCLVLQ
ncbi:hypothetical protein K7432_010416 [Basidiobolus ranarum]|uniref:Aminoglycoside phosphotransferase domain-containing protein n=1 Tax=Basidiobolus ranarum TaxID=34480 RepID=A0ABR2VVG8_9FUNG